MLPLRMEHRIGNLFPVAHLRWDPIPRCDGPSAGTVGIGPSGVERLLQLLGGVLGVGWLGAGLGLGVGRSMGGSGRVGVYVGVVGSVGIVGDMKGGGRGCGVSVMRGMGVVWDVVGGRCELGKAGDVVGRDG